LCRLPEIVCRVAQRREIPRDEEQGTGVFPLDRDLRGDLTSRPVEDRKGGPPGRERDAAMSVRFQGSVFMTRIGVPEIAEVLILAPMAPVAPVISWRATS